jgi:hypothetical protein
MASCAVTFAQLKQILEIYRVGVVGKTASYEALCTVDTELERFRYEFYNELPCGAVNPSYTFKNGLRLAYYRAQVLV